MHDWCVFECSDFVSEIKTVIIIIMSTFSILKVVDPKKIIMFGIDGAEVINLQGQQEIAILIQKYV